MLTSGARSTTAASESDQTLWSQKIAKCTGHGKTCDTAARKLTVNMHAMWSDGMFYVGDLAAARLPPRSAPTSRNRKLLRSHG